MQRLKRICVLILALCLLFGTMPVITLATEDTETKVVKQQILLGDDLTMRFYVHVREEHRTKGVMNIRVGRRSENFAVADMTPNADGLYVFSVDLSAAEMTEDITLTLTTEKVNGPLKLSGVWFVSKEDYTKIQTGEGNVVSMAAKGERDYLFAAMPAQEGAEVGGASTMVTIDGDPAWAGIQTQATIKAAQGITNIGDQKSVVIDSPIGEGYFNESGNTYPLFALDCGWGRLDTATQDIMFYVELPANSSEFRMDHPTCNGWSFWVAPSGMEYQYLSVDSHAWESGRVTTDGNNTLALTQGFRGYVRLKINTAENAEQFPDTTLQIQNVRIRLERFGGDNGAFKMSGVWFVSKEDFTKVQTADGKVFAMTPAGRDYLLAAQPAQESGEIGQASSMVSLDSDGAWAGISTQATMKAAWGIALGEYESTVIDSPIGEGYFNESGNTYPLFALNCGWGSLNTATQDIMFYVELPAVSSGLRINGITCNSWSFWAAPSGMQYQYLAVDGSEWINGTITTDENKTLTLPQGFKGYIRLRVNTAENAAAFPDTTLTVQNFTFQCDRFGGQPVLQSVYSVRDYARYILENNYTAETKNLVKQMLNYGAKAQMYFGHKTDNLANLGYEVESTAVIGDESPEVVVNGSVDGVSFYGCSMLLESKLATRYYFNAPNGVDGYTFKIGDTEVTPVAKSRMFFVEESGITPDRMDSLTTVTVTKGAERMSVQYSPMYYITRMYNRPSAEQPLKDLLLAAAGYFEAAKVFTGVAENEYIRLRTALAPICGTQDDFLEYNPDRGWRLEAYVSVQYVAGQPDSAYEIVKGLNNYREYNPQLCQVYFYLTDYGDYEGAWQYIDETGFNRMQHVFDTAREKGIKLIVRYSYQRDMAGTGEASDEAMLAHMKQIKESGILERNQDVIHTVEAGFLGSWGEWHSFKQEHNELALLKGILDMVPENLYVQVRYPRVRNVLADVEPDNPNLSRMGYHDDSFFGWQNAVGNDGVGLNPGNVNWEQMRIESPYRPQGGEMFWGVEYDLQKWNPTTGEMAIRKYSAFHQNSFSLYHSFIENRPGFVDWVEEADKNAGKVVGYYSMLDWLTEPVTREWLDSYGIAYDPLWFQNENGESIARTAFEFVHDHLGYRLRALDVTLDGNLACGDTLNVSMNLKNTGFSAVFNMESGFALLDADGNVVSAVTAGNPTEWLPTDPNTNAPLTHNVAAPLTLPQKPGTYQVAFYVRNTAGTSARLANDLPFVNGCTVLKTIVLR